MNKRQFIAKNSWKTDKRYISQLKDGVFLEREKIAKKTARAEKISHTQIVLFTSLRKEWYRIWNRRFDFSQSFFSQW